MPVVTRDYSPNGDIGALVPSSTVILLKQDHFDADLAFDWDERQQHVGGTGGIMEDRVPGRKFAPGPGRILAGVRVDIEAWEVAGRQIQSDAVPGDEKVASTGGLKSPSSIMSALRLER